MLIGAVQIAPDIADFFGNLAGGLFWKHEEGPPTPIYGPAERFAGEGKYVEAEAEYEAIIEEFPDETKPHIDLIDIAFKRLDNPTLAQQFYERGMKKLRQEEDRQVLADAYGRALELHFQPKTTVRRVISLNRDKADGPDQ